MFAIVNNITESTLKKSAILKTLNDEKAPLALIEIYLKEKYQIQETISLDILSKAQIALFYNNIEIKNAHKKLYDSKKNEKVDIDGSSIWLTKRNYKARNEARLCYLQDRNMLGDKPGNCPYCKAKIKELII